MSSSWFFVNLGQNHTREIVSVQRLLSNTDLILRMWIAVPKFPALKTQEKSSKKIQKKMDCLMIMIKMMSPEACWMNVIMTSSSRRLLFSAQKSCWGALKLVFPGSFNDELWLPMFSDLRAEGPPFIFIFHQILNYRAFVLKHPKARFFKTENTVMHLFSFELTRTRFSPQTNQQPKNFWNSEFGSNIR